MDVSVEEATFRAFIRRERRERYVARLKTRTRRKKLLGELYHLYDLDGRFIRRLEPQEQAPRQVYELLRRLGAPETCYVISAWSELDGQEAELRAALEEIVGFDDGSLISCIPGRLAYYEGEDERFILRRG